MFSNEQIAAFLDIHPQTLVYLKQTPEFKARIIALQTGIIEQNNIEIREDAEFQREELKALVPLSLLKLREHALSNNPVISLKAIQDILDREGTHAKVSRSSIDLKEVVNLNVVNDAADVINSVLKNAPILRDEHGEIDQNNTVGIASSNSNSSPSDKTGINDPAVLRDMTDAEIAAEFTRGATDSKSQIYMMEEQINENTLDQIDAKKLIVN